VWANTISLSIDDQGKQTLNLDISTEYTDKWSTWFDYTHVRETRNFNKKEVTVGAGPKYTFYDEGSSEASLSVGVLSHTYEGRDTVKASIRPRIQNEYGSLVLYYQPNLNESKDYMYSGDLKVVVTKRLNLWYSASYRSLTEDRHYIYEGGVTYDFK
jgi:outer membrane receptor for ferric coprogen and ferric-rhodotorulic acid